MSFLRVNGWVIPIKESNIEIKEIGSRSTAHAGNPLTDIRTTKRVIKGVTTPMTEMNAEAFKGLVRGAGDHWTFNNTAYSDKGLSPDTNNGIAYLDKTAGDGSTIALNVNSSYEVTAEGAKYGSNGVLFHAANVSNILTDDQSDAENGDPPSGYSAVVVSGSTLSNDTSNYMQGSQSLKCIASATGDGFETDYVSCSGSTKYEISLYVKATSNKTLQIESYDNVQGRYAYGYVYAKANTWVRARSTIDTHASATQVKLRVISNDDAVTFYADQMQIHESANIEHAIGGAPWVLGATTRNGATVTYSALFLKNAKDITIAFWHPARLSYISGRNGYLSRIIDDGSLPLGDEALGLFKTSTDALRGEFVIDGTTYHQSSGSISETETMNHFLFTSRRNPETGEYHTYLYDNGSLLDTATTPGDPVPNWSDSVSLLLNSDDINGAYDDLIITPYAMPAAQISALYNMGKAWPTMPSFYVDGDIIPDDELTTLFQGRITGIKNIQAGDTSWRNNWQEIEFELTEV